eukprot:gb/GFBE01020384.1/.p1 GENE.gb/GFBE01020384.1/~~gb/GFBE01020384.1/.p1  ORF type:complete len:383 (+),score=54.66 gb/GFBE01020384.1/:1-1149(+)
MLRVLQNNMPVLVQSSCRSIGLYLRTCSTAARPPRSQFLHKRPDLSTSSAATASAVDPQGFPEPQQPQKNQSQSQLQQTSPQQQQPQRYGPLDVDLKPRDQLRPLLPTWNPPPTRRPRPEELEVSTRLRFRLEDRWWAATVREVSENEVKVGYDGWPSRHDETVPRDSDRLYLHESFHEDYVAPPLPQRYQRPTATDAEGNPLPAGPRAPRPKVYDPEKERMKRALRPPLPYNPEKERLKRLLRGQYAPPVSNFEPPVQEQPGSTDEPAVVESPLHPVQQTEPGSSSATPARQFGLGQPGQARPDGAMQPVPAPPAAPAPPLVEWTEVPGGVNGTRAFRHAVSGEVRQGPPPTTSWVELLADGGNSYYWHVGRNITQWEKPQ